MAEAVSEQRPEPLARRRAEQNATRHRFGLAYLALAALLGAGVGLFVVLAANGDKNSGPPWSTWKPTESGIKGLDQIAKHVSRQYALPSRHTLVAVLSTPPVVQGSGQTVPVRAIAVATGLPGESVNDAQFFNGSGAWAYVLCGLGQNCAISDGKASIERGQLLRREALELALYTFKYNSDVNLLLTFMPPPVGQQAKAVLFFQRANFETPLKAPLARTLPPPRTTLLPGKMSASDLARVRRYADPHVYTFQYQQIPDGTAIMVLRPLTA